MNKDNISIEKIFELFFEGSKEIIEKNTKNDETAYFWKKWKSKFNDEGVYYTSERITRFNHKKFFGLVKENERNNIKNIFNKIKNEFSSFNDEEINDIIEVVFSTYYRESQNTKFNESVFKTTISKVVSWLNDGFNFREYFVPIYGLKLKKHEFKIDDYSIIKKISEIEFNRIVDLGYNKSEEEPVINFEFKKLGFILYLKIPKNSPDANSPQKIGKRISESLRLAHDGFISMGAYYPYNTKGIAKGYRPRLEPLEIQPIFQNSYILEKNDEEKIIAIIELMKKIDEIENESSNGKKDVEFIKSAIRRFNKIYQIHETVQTRTDIEFQPLEKITDLIIALETILNTDKSDISLSLAQRTAMLLGKNESDKEEIFIFMKKSYGLRSFIVHGKQKKDKIIIDGNELTDEEIELKLENYIRLVIIKILSLILELKKKDTIIQKIDKITTNRDYQIEISNIVNKNTNFFS